MKRILAMCLVLAMAAAMLTGCGGGSSTSGSGSGSSSSAGSSAGSGSDSGSGSSASSSEVETVDLSTVSDPWMYTAGMKGDTVIGTVGGHDITANVYFYWMNSHLSSLASEYMMYYGTDIPWDTEIDEDGTTIREQAKRSALEGAALYCLLPVKAQEAGVTLDENVMEQMQSSQEELMTTLKDEKLVEHYYWLAMASYDLLESLYEAGQMGSALQDHYYGENSDGYPTDAEALAYGDEEMGYYKVKHILLATIDTTTGEALDDETKAQKKTQAEDLLAQLRAADDPVALFDELMNQYSEDPGLASNPDGYDATEGEMYPEFEEAALALEVGEISDIVESTSGYHIILRLPPDLDMLRSELVSARMTDLTDQWLEEAGLETNDSYEQIDPETFWKKATVLQQSVYDELLPIFSAEAGVSGSSSGSTSASGSASGSASASGSVG